MRVAIEYEAAQGRDVTDVHEKNLGYDITSLDTNSGELRLIEVKGIGGKEGVVGLTPNENALPRIAVTVTGYTRLVAASFSKVLG
jgi:Domain of unknown function (DUF3883)